MAGLMGLLDQAANTRVSNLTNLLPAKDTQPPLVMPQNMKEAPDTEGNSGSSDIMQKAMGLMQFINSNKQAAAGPGRGTPTDTTVGKMNDTQDPWGVDPDGMDLVTRHGVTLDQEAMQSLIQARRAGYNPFPYIGGGYRSIADSNALYAQRHDANGNLLPGVLPAAPGGHSMHNFGLAFDAGSLPQRIAEWLYQNGWYNGASFGDPVHYSYYRKG